MAGDHSLLGFVTPDKLNIPSLFALFEVYDALNKNDFALLVEKPYFIVILDSAQQNVVSKLWCRKA